MNTFKRKALSSAVLAGLGAAGAAHAVYLNPNGLGQALVFPYYTVQTAGGGSYNTYVSVVNTTDEVKVVKVRFREGKNSREVLDFNLYLSPNDVFAGAIVPAGDAATAGGRFVTTDLSCTNPALPALGGGLLGIDFRNYLYSGANAEAAGVNEGLDRSREGYTEMIEMGRLTGAGTTALAAAATHGAGGTAPTCTGLRGNPTTGGVAGVISAPTGGLAGAGTLINVNSGADAAYNAVALANLSTVAMYAEIGNDTPNFNSIQVDPISLVIANNAAYRSVFTEPTRAPAQAVSATMMHSSLINEFVLDTATKSNSDWVVTFPTKQFFVTTAAFFTPFSQKYVAASGSCETVAFSYFNREEVSATALGVDFSPLPPGAPASAVCWESTVISIRNGTTHMPTGTASGVLGSTNAVPVNVNTGFQNGWARLAFTGALATTTGLPSDAASSRTDILAGGAPAAGAQTFLGLPAVGFMLRTLNNGTLTCGTASCNGTYGSLHDHRNIITVTP